MPPRSVKMKRRILGFQRRVWWPKCTPASSSSRMEATAITDSFSVSICTAPAGLVSAPATKAGTRALGESAGSGDWDERKSLAGARQSGFEGVRKRRANVHGRPRERVLECEPRGVQELPLEPEIARPPVERVAGDGQIDGREMHA